MWPMEAMPKVLRWIGYVVPTTLPSLSMRGIIYKGSSIYESEVYLGFLIILGWLILFLILTIFLVKSKS
ncbi:ABC transporter G family member 20 [Cyphomyrmex costatus]|uniref:ABC transporter G family member 20 n=1 Tax=Cyphomyrmex costatus TaxID=456900 RepID=A0A151K1U8_9HYME|nr:ABC transporter G family member 20 [Cyphomyrmex costatus]